MDKQVRAGGAIMVEYDVDSSKSHLTSASVATRGKPLSAEYKFGFKKQIRPVMISWRISIYCTTKQKIHVTFLF
jgi:hypothetical protein